MKHTRTSILLLIACLCGQALVAQICTGSGTIKVSVENCLSSSEPSDAFISISPNPALDYFVVENRGGSAQFELFDQWGKKIREDKLAGASKTKLPTEGLAPGVYIAVCQEYISKKKVAARIEIFR